MRIGVDASCWTNKRGFGRFTRELLKALIAADRRNEYLFFSDRETALGSEFPKGVRVVPVRVKVAPIQAASAEGRRSLSDLWAMSREVLKHDLDLFFFPAVYSYFPVLNRTKIIVTIHDMTPKRYPDKIFSRKKMEVFWSLKEYLAVKQAKVILTVSEHSKREIQRYYGFRSDRIRTISEGPSAVFRLLPWDRRFSDTLGRYHLDPSQRYLLYVGGISPHKNLKGLAQAYFEVTSDPAFSDVKLVVAGDYQKDSFLSDYSSLRDLIDRLDRDGRVIFTGYVDDEDLVCLYNGATLFVFPSLQEGFGLPGVEAMACGAPVAASNMGSLPEVLGDAGRFFDPNDPLEMVKVIKDILSDHEMRTAMSRRGLERAKLFSWDKSAKDLLDIFESMAGN